jgi:energy-coupling factor transporter ATP-binding protein EcfA2
MNSLNTTNQNQLEYQNKLIKITILGGIRLDGLDRMRVTVKIQATEVEGLAVRHNLDLYNDTQVEKLIRKTASKLEIGTSVIEASINELIEALEKYRLEELENTTPKVEIKQLTEQEKTEALALLTSYDLLPTTNNLIGKSGIIGEETNRLIMYLIFSSRKREQPLHIISLGSSGTGKTHLQESIGNLIPNEEKVEITTLSENAFYYFGQQELKHKLILIEDLDGAESALYPIRELQSKKRISKTVAFKNTKGETKSQNITVEGPVCVSGCTTKESIYEDNANRSFLIYLDESPDQDQKIMNYQRRASAGKINIEEEIKAKTLLQNSQYLLKPIKVVNPFAEVLELPNEVLKPRRTNAHYLQFIELITYYHQYQRELKYDETTGEEYIETTIEDIKNANELIKEVIIRKSDVLNGATRTYFEKLKELLKANKKTDYTNGWIRNQLRIPKTTQWRYHTYLMDVGLIQKTDNKEQVTYQISNKKEYEQLKNQIDNILQNTLNQIQSISKDSSSVPTSSKVKVERIKKTKSVS